MQFINEVNYIYSQWLNSTQKMFCYVETEFNQHLNFLELSTLFIKFRKENPDSPLTQLHVLSFIPTSTTLENKYLTAEKLEYYSIYNVFKKQIPANIPGCHRLLFEDGTVLLDLWLGDFISQFSDAFIRDNSTVNTKSKSLSMDAWYVNENQINKLSNIEIQRFFKCITYNSANNATLTTNYVNPQITTVINKYGFTPDVNKCNVIPELANTKHYINNECAIYPIKINDIAIIGGGIASLCTALSLAQRHKNVTIYCKDAILGTGASGNRQGALYPLINQQHDALSQLFTNAYLYAVNFYQDLHTQFPFSHKFNGLIQLAYDESARRKLLKIENAALPKQLSHWVTADQVNELAGIDVGHEGLYYPNAGWLSPREVIISLKNKLSTYKNVTILCNHKIECISHVNHAASDLYNDSYTQADWQLSIAKCAHSQHTQTKTHQAVIIAAGMNTLKFEQCRAVPLSAARGQVSHIKSNTSLAALKLTLCHEGYLTPSMNGMHCMGATFKRHDLETEYRQHEQTENHQKLKKCVANKLWVDSIETDDQAHIGIRCTTRDHFPYVGPLTDYNTLKKQYESKEIATEHFHELPNIYLLTGLGSRGLCTAPLLGEVIASQISGEPMPISHQIYKKMEIPRQWRNYIRKNKTLKE